MLPLVEVDDDPVVLDEDVDDDTLDEELELLDDRDVSESFTHGGSPLLEKSFNRRKEIVSLMMDALSN